MEALAAMGYRKATPIKWIKPVGYHVFMFNLRTMVWGNYFRDDQGNIVVWETKNFHKDMDFLAKLKEVENVTRLDIFANIASTFHIGWVP